MTKVIAHMADIKQPTIKNPCNEILLPVLIEPKTITLLRLQGIDVFDYTESLGMSPELVDQERVYKMSYSNRKQQIYEDKIQ